MSKIARRDFLRAAPATAGLAALVAGKTGLLAEMEDTPAAKPADVKIAGTAYTPIADYPIQPKRYSEVTLTDTFWKPKVVTNAEVTIPFEVEKLSGMERGFGGNVLEAAILSLKTHPDAKLQAQVDARIQQLKGSPGRGNNGFEVAATYYNATGKRDLLDLAIKTADTL